MLTAQRGVSSVGADLYIRSLYDKQKQEWEPAFNNAVQERDRLSHGTPEYEKADALVWDYYERMNVSGYFRDPYNGWDVLWQFGLSWWEDVIPLLDDHHLSVVNTKKLLDMLDAHQSLFETSMAETEEEDERQYFRQQSDALRAFLTEAIDLDEPIDCSL
jgi:hypothetical protein